MKRKILRFLLALLIYIGMLLMIITPLHSYGLYKIMFLAVPICGLLLAKPAFLIAEAVFDRAFDWRDES